MCLVHIGILEPPAGPEREEIAKRAPNAVHQVANAGVFSGAPLVCLAWRDHVIGDIGPQFLQRLHCQRGAAATGSDDKQCPGFVFGD